MERETRSQAGGNAAVTTATEASKAVSVRFRRHHKPREHLTWKPGLAADALSRFPV